MGRIGVTELIVVLIIVLIIFGPKQLPKLSKTLGETLRGFKEGMQDDSDKPAEKEESGATAKAITADTEEKTSGSDTADKDKA